MNGEQIREARRKKGWTQLDLAERAKLSQATISLIERGQRAPVDALKAIATALGIRESKTNKPKYEYTTQALIEPIAPLQPAMSLPIQISRWHRPEQSGDFFLALPLHKGGVLIAAIDVVGHGASAYPKALYLQGWFRGWLQGHSAAPRIEDLSRDFTAELLSIDWEAAYFLALLRPQQSSHLFSYESISSSFPAPLFVTSVPSRTTDSIADVTGRPLYRDTPLGSWRLVIASDGLLRRLGAGNERQGLRSLLTWQQGANRDEPPEKYLQTSSPISDDETFMSIVYRGWDLETSLDTTSATERHRLLRVLSEKSLTCVGVQQTQRLQQAIVEAVDNIRRHATRVAKIRFRAEGERCRVEVEDEGPGFLPSDTTNKSGLAIMERMVSLVDLRRAHPKGMIITLFQEKNA